MDFLDTVAGGVDDAVRDALAPVTAVADRAAVELRRELTQTWHGIFGSPTMPGGTNWNAYSHEELAAMVADGDSVQVGEQAWVLNGLGRGAYDCVESLATHRQDVPGFWRSNASAAFGSTLDEHTTGGAAVADHVTALANAVGQASTAVARARARMPAPVDVPAATTYGAAAGGAGGALAGGGAAAAIGAVAGAGTSWFGASVLAANRKAEAVEVMQDYEASLRAADPPPAPAKLPPGVPSPTPAPVPMPQPRPGAGPGPRARSLPRTASTGANPTSGGGSGGATGGGSGGAAAIPGVGAAGTDPSLAGLPNPQNAAPPGASTPSPGATVAAGTTPPLAVPLGPGGPGRGARAGRTSGVPATGWGTGQDGRTSGPPVGWRQLVGNGALPGLITDPEPRYGQAARTAPQSGARGVPGLPGPATGGRREEDREHQNRMPRNDRLFTVDEKTPPPVIGA